jgi:hypothetical protein
VKICRIGQDDPDGMNIITENRKNCKEPEGNRDTKKSLVNSGFWDLETTFERSRRDFGTLGITVVKPGIFYGNSQ